MKTVVIKHDGCQVIFDKNRIKEAVVRTATGICDEQYYTVVASVVEQQLDNCQAVENQLMASQYKDLARNYIEYRHERDITRSNIFV